MALRTHPFGPPMEATLARDGDQLVLTWTAAEDDWVIVGNLSGAFDDLAEGETGEDVLKDSAEVHDFLAEHLVVSQDGEACTRDWLPTRDLLGEGVRARFTCPDPDAPVDVHVDVLTDVNEAYRTVLRAEPVGEVLFTSAEPEHEIATAGLGDGGTTGSELTLLAVLFALVVVGAVVLGVVMARGSRRPGDGAGSDPRAAVTS